MARWAPPPSPRRGATTAARMGASPRAWRCPGGDTAATNIPMTTMMMRTSKWKMPKALVGRRRGPTETGDPLGGALRTKKLARAAGSKKGSTGGAGKKSGETEKINAGGANKDGGEAKEEGKKGAAKNDAEGSEGEDPAPDASLPLLVGTLTYSDRDGLRRHIIRGTWKYDGSHAVSPQRFELIRQIPADEKLEELPKDGEFAGSFNVQQAVKTSKGKIKMKNRAVPESGVQLHFKVKDEGKGTYSVSGKGTNEYGVFELFGKASKNKKDGDDVAPTYSVSVHKKYVAVPPEPLARADPPAGGAKKGKKDKKRKLAETAKEEEEKPPVTELPKDGVFLRGKLVRNTSDELSLDNTAVHRITGSWAMGGLSKLIDDPGSCEKFEYEHKSTGGSSVFPLSGRYTGFFYVSEAGERTKIAERDVTLKFRENNGGYYNVEGKGSNIFGKYNITGTLDNDGMITLYRHFQAPKVKAGKKSTQDKISAPAKPKPNGISKPSPKAREAVVGSPSLPLSFDDVDMPVGDEPVPPLSPPNQFTATSRGILKIEDDGTHTCSGSWAMTNEHYLNGLTSKYHFGIEARDAAEDAEAMLELMESDGRDEDDDRRIKGLSGDGVAPVTLATSTFPIDSARYKGSFKMRKGATRSQTIVDPQIVLRFVKNSGGSFNVYGKGTNEMGMFDLVGTLILQGKTNGLMQLYRIYPPDPPAAAVPTSSKKSSKVFPGSLTEKATPANSEPAPAMKPPEPFVPSMSGLQRRESSRMSRLPSRLEEDDPQAQMDRLMERCRQILKELQESDVNQLFSAPVDPLALGIPTYLDVIKDPMDLGTIKAKMDNDEIDSPEEFARLIRLTFENAITFNTLPDNIVHVTARGLLASFIKKFGSIDKAYVAAKKNRKLTKAERNELKRKEKEAAREEKRRAKEERDRKRKAEVEALNESKRTKLDSVLAVNKSTMAAIAEAAPENPDANMTRVEYNLLVDAIKQMQEQIVGLHKLVKKSMKSGNIDDKVVSAGSSAPVPSVTAESHVSTTPQPPKPKKKKLKKGTEPEPTPPPSPKTFPVQAPAAEDLQPLSFDEQEALSEAINLLPERLLPGAMQIIREADFVNDDDDEIDLDIDQLDTKTQRKLQSFVMQNVKTKKKKKQPKKPKQTAQAAPPAPAPAPTAPPSPSPPPPEEEAKPSAASRAPGGKSFFALGDDDDSDDDKEDDDEEDDLKADFATNWVANSTGGDAAGGKDAGDDGSDDDDDDGDGLWGATRKEAEAAKAQAADRAKREEKMRAEAETAARKRMEEAAARGEEVRAKREEEEAAEARRLEEQEREAEEAKRLAREEALKEINSVKTTVDLGDEQRDLMRQYEQEFNDNYSAGASPSSDFGF